MDPAENILSIDDCEMCDSNMDLSSFVIPSDISRSGSDNSANSSSISSTDYEVLQPTSTADSVLLDAELEHRTMFMNALKWSESETDGESVNAQFEHLPEPESTTLSGELDRMECSQSDHVLDDWHMVNQYTEKYDLSDDDSLEILDREVATPSYALTKVDVHVGPEEENSALMTTSMITVDKHVQTNDVDSGSAQELLPLTEESNVIEPSHPCPVTNFFVRLMQCLIVVGCVFSLFLLIYTVVLNMYKDFTHITPKPNVDEANDAVMDFMVHVVRDFSSRMEELQRNMDYIAEKRDHGLDSNKPEELKEYLRQDLVAMNTFFDRFREEGKSVFANNKALYQQMEILRDSVYVLNVHDFVRRSPNPLLLPKSVFALLALAHRVPPCNVAAPADGAVAPDEQLPLLCRDHRRNVLLIFHSNHLLSVTLHSEAFYQKVSEKFAQGFPPPLPLTVGASPVAGETPAAEVKQDTSAETSAAEDAAVDAERVSAVGAATANAFAPDCDNFSKHYRSDYCAESTSLIECAARGGAEGDVVETGARADDAKTCSRAVDVEAQSAVQCASSVDDAAPSKNDGDDDVAAAAKSGRQNDKSLKFLNEFKTLIGRFKEDFETFYALCAEAEESLYGDEETVENDEDDDVAAGAGTGNEEASVTASDNDIFSAEEDGVLLPPPPPPPPYPSSVAGDEQRQREEHQSATNSLSGDWFFNLNEARAKLRHYYETTVSGDWILKLGKAREKLRKHFGEYRNKFVKEDDSSFSAASSTPPSSSSSFSSSSSSSFQKQRRDEPKMKREKRWSMPSSKQLKHKLKNLSSKWKKQFKRMKDGFVRHYEKFVPPSWRFDFKNGWFYS